MKVSHMAKVDVDVEIIDRIVCNQCGQDLPRLDFGDDVHLHRHFVGMKEHTYRGGYHSDVLEDLTDYIWSMCEPCLKAMFDGFKVPVRVFDRLGDPPPESEDEQ